MLCTFNLVEIVDIYHILILFVLISLWMTKFTIFYSIIWPQAFFIFNFSENHQICNIWLNFVILALIYTFVHLI